MNDSFDVNRFRDLNEEISEFARDLGFVDEPIPFLCECDDLRCTALIWLTLVDYAHVRSHASRFVVLSTHATHAVIICEGRRFAVIEKAVSGTR